MCYVAIGTQFVLRSKEQRRTVLEKGFTVVVLEICLSKKALMKVKCNLETVNNGGKSALLNAKETAILYDFLIDNG